MEKTFIELFETESKKGFKWEKNDSYYYLFPANGESAQGKGVVYRLLKFDNIEDFNKRLLGERVDAKQIVGIKEMHGDKGVWYSGILFDRDNKQARYVNLYDNVAPSPEKPYDKLIALKEAEYREKTDAVAQLRASIEIGD